jgi:4-hydroxy-2-oxoheptanedioate aldolase
MRFSRVKAKLRRGDPALIVTCHFTDPSVYELTSLLGFDGIWLDLEHHATSLETAGNLMRAARVGGADIIARCARWESMRMGRILEAGAQAIMYPRCETAAEAAEVVRWAKFAPEGQRGIDGANPDNPYCSMPMPQYFEPPLALENADAIAAVPGVDVLMLGPGDLSVLSGIPCQFDHPIIKEAYRRVASAAKQAGKWWGTVSPSPEHTRMLLDLGALFICHGADILAVKRVWEEVQQHYGELGFRFDNRLAAEAAELGKSP